MTSSHQPDTSDAVAEEIVQTPATPGAEALPTSDTDEDKADE